MIIGKKRSRFLYFSWAVVFLYFLVDDSMGIHENAGKAISEYFSIPTTFHLRGQDIGEQIVSGLFGMLMFGFVAVATVKSDRAERAKSIRLFYLILLLAFFGIFGDMLEIFFYPHGTAIWGLLEDGGEMIIMTVLLAYIFDINAARFNPSDPDLTRPSG